MKIINTALSGCFIIEPQIYPDERGYFFESYNKQKFEDHIGSKVDFVQDNQSFSKKGVIRALHYQIGEWSQAKLVRVLAGSVLDVAVDIRPDSPNFGKHISVVLSSENKKQLFIPRGFAHGFVTLSDTAEFSYKCDNYYNQQAEGGIIYNDPDINIDWGFSEDELIISEKDSLLPLLKNAKM